MAANRWEEKFGEQILLYENQGSKMGNKFFFFERNFLGRKFWGAYSGGADSFGEEILPAKFLENFLRVKSHSGEEKNTGKQVCFGGKIWGASKFLPLMVSP